jgi:hypothetical protein
MAGRKEASSEGESPSSQKKTTAIQPADSSGDVKAEPFREGAATKMPPVKRQPKIRKWKKPKDMPKRPLSAYNLFFAHERQEMIRLGSLQSPGSDSEIVGAPNIRKMGFAGLARTIGTKWKALIPASRIQYETQAKTEQGRYKMEMLEWKKTQEEKKLKDQHLQAEYAATTGAGSANSMCAGTNQPQSLPFANMEPANSDSQSWPTMPQTRANLGDTLDPAFAMPMMNFPPQGSQAMMPLQNQFSNSLPMEAVLSPLDNQNGAILPLPAPRRNVMSSDSANVASRGRINQLASQLDDESLNFLSSLNNSNPVRDTMECALRRKECS